MRVFLLLLLLAACASCGFLDHFGQGIKGLIKNIRTALNVAELYNVHEKFRDFSKTLEEKLQLSPERNFLLIELMKSIIQVRTDHVQEEGDSIDEINAKASVSDLLFQGDIVLTRTQAEEIIEDMIEEGEGNRTKRQAFRDPYYPQTIWSKGVNYYFYHNASAEVRRIFEKGAQQWAKDTCIDFRLNRAAPDRIRVFSEDGCWSYVGRLNREQDLSLGRGCESVAIAAHEIGHALGFFHTMSRHDRDDFITFNAHNVKPSWLDQFTKKTKRTNYNYGITYDYGSIMHYGARSASSNRRPTMVPLDTKYMQTLGSPFISFYELLMMNKHYNCLERCEEETSAQCEMGGFPHPRNCSQCICPSGYGGRLCNERPSGCGEVLEAKTTYQTLVDEVGNKTAGQKPREDMSICNYWIKAPVGSKIEVKIEDMSRGATVDGCSYWGVEIKTHADQKMTGYRFCAPENIGVTLVSSYHIVPVITYNRFYATRVKLQYRIEFPTAVSGDSGTSGDSNSSTRHGVSGESGGLARPDVSAGSGSVTRPRPQPTTNCVDNEQCPDLEEGMNFCKNTMISLTTRRIVCPKMCGFCR